MFFFWVMVFKLSKSLHFLQYFDNLSKKSEAIKEFYIYPSERSCFAWFKNGVVYFDMTYYFGNIRVWSWRALLNFCWATIFFYVFIADIPWMVVQTPINHIIFWTNVVRNFRYIYVICSNRIRFLAGVSTKLQKNAFFFGQFKNHNSGRKDGD